MELLSFTLPTFGAPGTILGSFLDDFVMDLGAARDFFSPGWGRELGSPNKSGPWMGWDGTHRWGGITGSGYRVSWALLEGLQRSLFLMAAGSSPAFLEGLVGFPRSILEVSCESSWSLSGPFLRALGSILVPDDFDGSRRSLGPL